MKQILKIDKMHKLFGKSEHICKECKHFKKIDTAGVMSRKSVQKCECYGITHSESSDWAQKWQACGLFDKPYNGKLIIDVRIPEIAEETELDEQLMLM